MSDSVILHTDGASRGNPGPASIGVVLTDPSGRVLAEVGEALPRPTTNNVAEYTAVIRGLERALKLGARRVRCEMDSQLVVRQLNGNYRVKHADMLPLYRQVLELVGRFEDVSFAHVPREMNTEADRLANAALDNRGASPEEVVRQLFTVLVEGRSESAAALLAEDFAYRRPALDRVEDGSRFVEAWRQGREMQWHIRQVRSFGADVLLEASDGNRGALLWLGTIAGQQVEGITEYRDIGA